MFWTRLASGVVLVILALLTIITGGNILLAVLWGISLIGLHEFYRAVGLEKKGKGLCIIGMTGVTLYYIGIFWNGSIGTMSILMLVLIAMMTVFVFSFPKVETADLFAAFFGVVYVAVMLSHIYLIRMEPDGKITVWLVFLSSWGSDTCAYCAGRLFGKHKMAPVLSPKKTVEGAIGGALGAAILGGVYAYIMFGVVSQRDPLSHVLIYVVICIFGALISMVGDLAASGIKRLFEIKDYGHLIPGHGGILDRFDSVIFTAPIIYMLWVFLV